MTKTKPALDDYKQSFREYLRETNVVKNDVELEELMKMLHEPLPVSFRLNLHRPDALRLQTLLATKFQFPSDKYFHENSSINPPKPITWYPQENVAWEMMCGRVALSKSAPKYDDIRIFHSWLLEQTDCGHIVRQEAVSMLPVLFLNVQPGHRVLDMCASPGSKTTQILDFLLSTSNDQENGLVIANDLDKKRAYMLVHRLSCNTLRRVVVTCGAGDTFPGLYDTKTKTLECTNVFDRVLCDVPCSGDGTLRKNQTLWKEWHIGQGLTLHPIQIAIALRGAALVKVGGTLVYSTCSFNPIENEAVVAEILRRADGALELLDVSMIIPELVVRPGRLKWRVGWRSKSKSTHKGQMLYQENNKVHQWFDTYEEVPSDLRGTRITRSMFPNEGTITKQLVKTLRLIPMDQNSGGFFVAVLHKVGDLPNKTGFQEGLDPFQEDQLLPPVAYICKLCGKSGHFLKNCENYKPDVEFSMCNTLIHSKKKRCIETPKKNITKKKKRETLYRNICDEIWNQLRDFYGLQDATLKNNLWCRSDAATTVFFVDTDISNACLSGDALEIVNTGLKVFTKVTEHKQIFYRPSEESLGFLDNYFTQRCLNISIVECLNLIEHAQDHVDFSKLSMDVQNVLSTISIGPAVVRVQAHEHIRMNVWVGQSALLPRVSKTKRQEIETALKEFTK
ncbi:putative SAM-dependent methyltransferase RsmB/NOP2-type, Zinc finger, CCHC-type [Plasmopara halstedii]